MEKLIKVVDENILLQLQEEKKEEIGELLSPIDSKKSVQGTIIAVGDRVENSVKELINLHHTVTLVDYHTGEKVKIKDKSFLVVNYKEILLIEVENDKNL